MKQPYAPTVLLPDSELRLPTLGNRGVSSDQNIA